MNDADRLRILAAFWGVYGPSALDRLPVTMSRAFASAGQHSDIMAAQSGIERRWQQLHEARERRDARLAPDREYGWQQYEAARARHGLGMTARAAGPVGMALDTRWYR